MMPTNKLTPDINYPVEYNAILMHKPLVKDCFEDLSNRLYLSDNNTPNTIDIKDSNWDSRLVGEYPAWLWLSKNIRECDRATLHHYRRKLPSSMSEIVLPMPIKLGGNMLEHLSFYHSPKIAEAFAKTLGQEEMKIAKGNELCCWDIFKAPQPVIAQWCEWCGNKLKFLASELGITIEYDSVKNFVLNGDSGLLDKHDRKNCDLTYQMRFLACCLERYNHIFWMGVPYTREYREVKLLEHNQYI